MINYNLVYQNFFFLSEVFLLLFFLAFLEDDSTFPPILQQATPFSTSS